MLSGEQKIHKCMWSAQNVGQTHLLNTADEPFRGEINPNRALKMLKYVCHAFVSNWIRILIRCLRGVATGDFLMREFLISYFRSEQLDKCCRHVRFDALHLEGHTCRGTGKLHLRNWPLKLFVEKVKAKLYWHHTLLEMIQVSLQIFPHLVILIHSLRLPLSQSFSLQSAVSTHTESEWTILRWQRHVFVASTTFMKYDRKVYCRKSYDLYNHSPGDWISYRLL